MGQENLFEIEFEKEQNIFYEGDLVTGSVKIVNCTELLYRAISVEIRGTAVAVWRNLPEKSNLITSSEEDDPIDLDELSLEEFTQETFLNQTCCVSKGGGDGNELVQLEPGEHGFLFECKLPLELPSSFEGQRGWVKYMARLIIDGPAAQSEDDIKTRRFFIVVNGLDLSFIPEAAAKIEVCKYRDMGVCCTEGSVTCDWTVARSGYVPGESIWIHGSIQNESKRRVTKSCVSLMLIIEYKSGKKHKSERRLVACVEKEPTAAGDMTLWNDPLVVPVLPPTGLGRCRLVDISYQLEFKALLDGAYSPIIVNKDIYIGTVKMSLTEMRSFSAALYSRRCGAAASPAPRVHSPTITIDASRSCSEISLTDIIAAAVGTTTSLPENPSAPILDESYDKMENIEAGTIEGGAGTTSAENSGSFIYNFNLSMDHVRPPPFAPGHEEELAYLLSP